MDRDAAQALCHRQRMPLIAVTLGTMIEKWFYILGFGGLTVLIIFAVFVFWAHEGHRKQKLDYERESRSVSQPPLDKTDADGGST